MVALSIAQATLDPTVTTKWLLQLQLVAVVAVLLAAAVVLVALLATARAARAGALPRLSTAAAQALLLEPSEDWRLAVTKQHQLQRRCALWLGSSVQQHLLYLPSCLLGSNALLVCQRPAGVVGVDRSVWLTDVLLLRLLLLPTGCA
jgi:hypothetical protein